jgi:hypothetical protein
VLRVVELLINVVELSVIATGPKVFLSTGLPWLPKIKMGTSVISDCGIGAGTGAMWVGFRKGVVEGIGAVIVSELEIEGVIGDEAEIGIGVATTCIVSVPM